MKYAVCIYNEDRWCPVDQEIEVGSLIEALSRIGDRYRTENLSYQEYVPSTVKLYATDYDRDRKILAIKEMRNLTGIGLKEAKDAVESMDQGNSRCLLGEFTIDKARIMLREADMTALKIEIAPDTHPGVAMLLKLQQFGGNLAR